MRRLLLYLPKFGLGGGSGGGGGLMTVPLQSPPPNHSTNKGPSFQLASYLDLDPQHGNTKQYFCPFSNRGDTVNHRKIRLIESNAKCCHLKELSCKGTLLEVFICLRPPPLLGFCLGWSSNFVGSESGQLQSVNSCRIWCPTGLNTPHPLPNKHYLSIF
jgi:hypothetical protein